MEAAALWKTAPQPSPARAERQGWAAGRREGGRAGGPPCHLLYAGALFSLRWFSFPVITLDSTYRFAVQSLLFFSITLNRGT